MSRNSNLKRKARKRPVRREWLSAHIIAQFAEWGKDYNDH